MEKIKTVGTRIEVFHGKAKHTSGGLKKNDLVHNKQGRIVSKNASTAAKKSNNLVKAGYKTEKGKFGAVYVGGNSGGDSKKTSKGTGNKKSSPKKNKSKKNNSFSFY